MFVNSSTWSVLPAAPWLAPARSPSECVGHGTVPAAAGEVAGKGVAGLLAPEPAGVADAASEGAADGLAEAEQAETSTAPQAAVSTARQAAVALDRRGAREDEVIGVLLPGRVSQE
jgi:hypothetical protein